MSIEQEPDPAISNLTAHVIDPATGEHSVRVEGPFAKQWLVCNCGWSRAVDSYPTTNDVATAMMNHAIGDDESDQHPLVRNLRAAVDFHATHNYDSRCTVCCPDSAVTLIAAAATELERIATMIDPRWSFKELEMKMRDGGWWTHGVMGDDTDSVNVTRWLCALLWSVLLDADNVEPPNYRAAEFEIKPGGTFEPIRLHAEVIKPGGRSSHEIRTALESDIARITALADEIVGAISRVSGITGPVAAAAVADWEAFKVQRSPRTETAP